MWSLELFSTPVSSPVKQYVARDVWLLLWFECIYASQGFATGNRSCCNLRP